VERREELLMIGTQILVEEQFELQAFGSKISFTGSPWHVKFNNRLMKRSLKKFTELANTRPMLWWDESKSIKTEGASSKKYLDVNFLDVGSAWA